MLTALGEVQGGVALDVPDSLWQQALKPVFALADPSICLEGRVFPGRREEAIWLLWPASLEAHSWANAWRD